MEFDDFRKTHYDLWNRYLDSICSSISKKKTTLGEGLLLYPTLVLYTETDEHYVAELFGAAKRYTPMINRTHHVSSTAKYLYQFSDNQQNPMFYANARNFLIKTMILTRDVDLAKVQERFGTHLYDRLGTRLHMTKAGGSLLGFGPAFESCYLDDCLIINTHHQLYRMKSILNLTVISKTFTTTHFVQDMQSHLKWPVQSTRDLLGVYFSPRTSVEAYLLSGQFANLFLVPQLREPNIGKFLHTNPNFTRNALGCSEFLYEKPLPWREAPTKMQEESIKPDLLLRRTTDGLWDICDLKKPLLDKANLTKGGTSRRRFIDYVQEGIAQLANYEYYFTLKANADFAAQRYGVIVDKPRLSLIAGNYENADAAEIEQATRSVPPNCAVIDYDTLNSNFRRAIESKQPSTSHDLHLNHST